MMGSPKEEIGRRSDEVLHKVTITKVFWLADTACTQALWEAVMGDNPSRFKGSDRPVENVRWHDIQEFLRIVNADKRYIKFRLPTEAEWEYACRAGTTGPFSFGDNITTDQVNYNGNYPYVDDVEGIYRKETVRVKSLPCNEWGLYQMHGNVWEWCSDRYGDYTGEAVVDPKGPQRGGGRILRGGSWFDDAWLVRCACRYDLSPASRGNIIGFRLAIS